MKKLEFEVLFNKSACPKPRDELAYIEGFKSLEGLGKVTLEFMEKINQTIKTAIFGAYYSLTFKKPLIKKWRS